jgi:hypothetical protein
VHPDHSAPVYVTIGDGGNLEGLATKQSHFARLFDLRERMKAGLFFQDRASMYYIKTEE